MLETLFKSFSTMNKLIYDQETEIITAMRNGVSVKIDAFQFYLWADRNGMTTTGEEIAYMDGNSMSYTLINDERMDQDEFLMGINHGEIDLEDIQDYLKDGGTTL